MRREYDMRLVVTRPQADGERTAAALRARGHEVLLAPLHAGRAGRGRSFRQLGRASSSPAPTRRGAIAGNPACEALFKLPVFAVGQRSAEAARDGGICRRHLGRRRRARSGAAHRRAASPTPRRRCSISPAKTAPPIWWANWSCTASRPRWRWSTARSPRRFQPALTAALKAGEVDAVLHFSKRSAENYLAGAAQAGVAGQALGVRHLCLSAQIAAPFTEPAPAASPSRRGRTSRR